MLIGHFSRKPMVAIKDGDTVLDPVDLEGNVVRVEVTDDHIAIGIRDTETITLEVLEAEELGFSILTVVEHQADLSYTVQRADRGHEPPRASDDERILIDTILIPHIADPSLRGQVRDEVIAALRG